jgi:medium-chain acyl-[acyl-carrier-protein] hydrolase
LFCFPNAGAGASAFRPWADELSGLAEIVAIQPPGREWRHREAPLRSRTSLVRAIDEALRPWPAAPFAFYGHSVGAVVAFELARELRRRGAPLPVHLFVSGRRAPHLPDPDPLHALPEPRLIEKLRALGGTPDAVLSDPDMMALFLPILRADLAVNEAEEHRAEDALDCPISAFGGLSDPRASRAEIDAWRQHTRRAFALEMFPGGHFFVQSARGALLRSVARTIERIAADLSGGRPP